MILSVPLPDKNTWPVDVENEGSRNLECMVEMGGRKLWISFKDSRWVEEAEDIISIIFVFLWNIIHFGPG